MKQYIILFLLVIASVAATAQVRTKLNYNKDWYLTTPDSAVFIRVCIYDTTNGFFAGPLSDLYTSGKPEMTGSYKNYRKAGEFTFYYENGQVESKGMIDNQARSGPWQYFYPDGKLKMEVDFAPNGRQPKVTTLNDRDGKILIEKGNGDWIETVTINGNLYHIEGHYKNSNKDGHWIQQGPESHQLDEWFRDGEFSKGVEKSQGVETKTSEPAMHSLPFPEKLSITENFNATNGVSLELYPILKYIRQNGQIVARPVHSEGGIKVYMTVDQQPEAIGGFSALSKFINNNLHYPAEARKKKISGSVFVEFIVETNGTLSNFKVIQGLGSGCDEEALRVVELMNKELPWYSGLLNGKPVKVRFVMPVKFKLG